MPLEVSRVLRPAVQMRQGPRIFSMVFTGDSDIPSSCDVKDEPTFKPLQGNPAFFRVGASPYHFHLSELTRGHSHIPIAEGSLLLMTLWKVGLPLQLNTEKDLSSRDDMGCIKLSSSCCAEIHIPLDLTRVSQGISGVA